MGHILPAQVVWIGSLGLGDGDHYGITQKAASQIGG